MKSNKGMINKKVIAAGIALTVLVTGTFAWQSFSQEATNEIISEVEQPGARLHDYYNGTTKEVFVENYGTAGTGSDVFARIRLDEYLEYGKDAGKGTNTSLTVVRGDIKNEDTPEFGDVKTWDTYDFVAAQAFDEETNEDDVIRKYRGLILGGDTMYMPTFNKHPYSLDADINGTLAGDDGDKEEGIAYDDYVNYTDVATVVGDVITPALADPTNPDSPDNVVSTGVTHTAEATAEATIISMEKWITDECPVGDFWVFDTDGWAYYAKAIPAGTATGLLLNSLDIKCNPADEWYYSINVTAQLASKGDWGIDGGETEVGTGMYAGGMTTNGEYLLNKVSGIATVSNMTIVQSNGDPLTTGQTVFTGSASVTYDIALNVVNGAMSEGAYIDPAAEAVTWSYVDELGAEAGADITSGGLFTTTTAGKYTITATSVLDSSKSVSITVTVE